MLTAIAPQVIESTRSQTRVIALPFALPDAYAERASPSTTIKQLAAASSQPLRLSRRPRPQTGEGNVWHEAY